MIHLKPFRALRPPSQLVKEVVAPPYDILSHEECCQIAYHHPYSFLNVSRSDLFSNTEQSRIRFNRIIQDCRFIQDDQPSLYIYRLKIKDHTQTGIVGAFSIDDYVKGQIKKHENVREFIVKDRAQHFLSIQAQIGPTFLFYPDHPEVSRITRRIQSELPIYDFISSDQIQHTVWRVPHPAPLVSLFASHVPALYIADGHHRIAATSSIRSSQIQYFLAAAFPASEVQILPYHRIIKDLNGLTPNQLLDTLRRSFEVLSGGNYPPQSGGFGMYLDRNWFHLKPLTPLHPSQLDVIFLQEQIISKIFAIHDLGTTQRVEFIGGSPDVKSLEKKVDSLASGVAFTVSAIPIERIIEVADQGQVLPPKSTWFEPKLPDGLFCFPFQSV